MKKIIGIMTAFAVTLCALSCVVMPVAFAEDSAETGEKTELIMGNIPDEPIPEFETELVGDTIKITTSPGAYYWGTMFFLITNDKFELTCNYDTGECLLKPESNGKYLILRPVGIPGTEGSFGYSAFNYYLLLIDIHDNVVDFSGEEAEDRYFEHRNFNYVCSFFEGLDSVFAYIGVDEKITENNPLYLVLMSEDKDCIYFDEDMSDISAFSPLDEPQKNYNSATIYISDYTERWLVNSVITGQSEEVFFKKENGILIKYSFLLNHHSWDTESDPTGVPAYVPNSFKSVVIPENDINLDGAVNLKDVFLLRRYIAGGWDIELKEIQKEMADLNGDEKIDLKDVVLLRRYIAGGWEQ